MATNPESATNPPSRRAITTVDLKALREPFISTCERYSLSPSEVLRRCVETALAAEQGGEPGVFGPESPSPKTESGRRQRGSKTSGLEREARPPGVASTGVRDPRRVRVEIRLSESEHAAVAALALEEGFSVQTWLIALMRARLVGGAQLGETELVELAKSNYELRAIGRNLNQVAKALNAGGVEQHHEPRLSLLQGIKERIDAHVSSVSAVLEGNLQRWKVRLR